MSKPSFEHESLTSWELVSRISQRQWLVWLTRFHVNITLFLKCPWILGPQGSDRIDSYLPQHVFTDWVNCQRELTADN